MSVDRLADGYEPRFDIDAAVGHQGELFTQNIAAGLADGSVEVKTDERAVATGNVYVEYACYRRGEWRPSGVQTTQAEFWAFVVGGRVLVSAPVADIRRAAQIAFKTGRKRECKRGSNPTRGVVIPLTVLVQWCADEEVSA